MEIFSNSDARERTICPHCYKNSFLEHVDIRFYKKNEESRQNHYFIAKNCANCNMLSIYRIGSSLDVYYGAILVYPSNTNAFLPPPPSMLDESMKEIYIEAIGTFNASPRSSCALLRLVLQALCDKYQCKGNNLAEKVNSLAVKYKFDIDGFIDAHLIRYGGNSALHEMMLDPDETAEDAKYYFLVLDNICKSIALADERTKKFSRLSESKQKEINKNYKEIVEEQDN